MKRPFFRCLLALVSVIFLPTISRAADLCASPVPTIAGLVRGAAEVDGRSCVWRGIPYAAPPVGNLRWASPQPHEAWSGVREATEWGARCMQKGVMELVNADPSGRMSEDCLYLNIWRPAKSGRFPVMVWVHGGGYAGGTGNSEWYWGDRMAANGDVVVVTINYRLTVFGFFPLKALREEDEHKSAGSQGGLDQVAALQWVHDNIANFGGDPDNVTIFGESAGGYSICMLVASPLAKGLFHRAIMESGGCESAPSLESGFDWAAATVPPATGCQVDDLDCLRELPAKTILDRLGSDMGGGMAGHYRPHVEGHALTASPLQMIRDGNYNRVPFIGGYNREEFGAMMKLNPSIYYAPPWSYERVIQKLGFTAEEAKRIAAAYPLKDHRNRVVLAVGQMAGADNGFGCATWRALNALSGHQPEVWAYSFEYEGFALSGAIGVAHAMEMPYIFDSLDRDPIKALYPPWRKKNAAGLVKIIQGYWLNFARTGDPNGPGLPAWPQFSSAEPRAQVLDAEVGPKPLAPLGQRCAVWEEIGHTPSWR